LNDRLNDHAKFAKEIIEEIVKLNIIKARINEN
jgi:hypothetical protein